VLESLISHVPDVDALIEVRTKYYHYIDSNEHVAACMILAGMSLELQIEYENMDTYNMIKHLKELFDVKGHETYNLTPLNYNSMKSQTFIY
jgi:hypothetical protein